MTFEKHLRSVSRAAENHMGFSSHIFITRLGILRKSWRVFDRFLGDPFGVLSCQFWSIVAPLPIHTLNYWTLFVVLYLDRVCQRGLHAVLWSHIGTYAPPRCRTLQYSRTFIPFSVSLWNDLAYPVFDGVGLSGFKSRANASLLA